MSLNPMKQVRTTDKSLMDFQSNANTAITQLQQQGIAESRLLTVTLPTMLGQDFNLQHSFGRPIKGYIVCRIPYATWQVIPQWIILYDSPSINPAPNSIAIVRADMASPLVGQALAVSVLVF